MSPPHASATIIVGVDSVAPSEAAVRFAARLAGPDGRLLLASALPLGLAPTRGGDPSYLEDVSRRARDVVDELALDVEDRVAGVETVVSVVPSPARMLDDLAAERGASLVVLGSSHLGRAGRVVPGSVAEKLLHGAPCAVVVVPEHAEPADGPLTRIGVAVDGSPESRIALRAAADIARAQRAELHVIAVCDTYRFGAPAAQNGPGFFIDHAERSRLARVRLEAAVAEVSQDVATVPVLREGAPVGQLVEASASLDLLLMGSRGYGPLRAVLLGGVGGAVLRDAACPVLITPRGAAIDAGAHAVATAA